MRAHLSTLSFGTRPEGRDRDDGTGTHFDARGSGASERGGGEGEKTVEMSAEGEGAPEVSMSAAKKALKAAEKQSKKRPDPLGLEAIEAGMAAMKLKEYAKAKEAFERAEELCAKSSVKAEGKPKAPDAAKEGGEKASKAAAVKVEKSALEATHLPPPGSEGHVTAKSKDNLPPGAKNYAVNSAEAMKAHLAATGGKWRTRFPPEPNGYLHIVHAKAMYFDFGVAKQFGGTTTLRFDDTNPEAEKQEYIDSIIGSVKWLGHEPVETTYSSDYFDQLYEYALQLIKSGNAYVCFQNTRSKRSSRASFCKRSKRRAWTVTFRVTTRRFRRAPRALGETQASRRTLNCLKR